MLAVGFVANVKQRLANSMVKRTNIQRLQYSKPDMDQAASPTPRTEGVARPRSDARLAGQG